MSFNVFSIITAAINFQFRKKKRLYCAKWGEYRSALRATQSYASLKTADQKSIKTRYHHFIIEVAQLSLHFQLNIEFRI